MKTKSSSKEISKETEKSVKSNSQSQKIISYAVIIPAYNEQENLSKTINSIREAFKINKLSPGIIVVDNNSTDETSKLAKKLGAKVVFQPIRNIGKTRNAGAKEAIANETNAEILFFIDADTKINSKLISKTFNTLKNQKIKAISCISSFDRYNSLSSFGVWFYNIASKILKLGVGQYVVVRKEVFDEVNGFDEEYYAFEEIDLFQRIKKKYGRNSFKVIFYPAITSGRKFKKGKKNTNTFLLLLLAQLTVKEVGKDKEKLDFWYGKSEKNKNTDSLENKEFIFGKWQNKFKPYLLVFIWFLFFSDNRFLVTGSSIRDYAFITTPLIFFMMIFLLIDRKKDLKIFFAVLSTTVLIEIIGSKTGLPFGLYEYNSLYGKVGILGVPIFIVIAWYILITTVSFITNNRYLTVGLIILIDILLEIFAVKSGLWVWQNPSAIPFLYAPILNYISWGVIAYMLYPLVTRQKVSLLYATSLLVVILGYISATLLIMGSNYGFFGYVIALLIVFLSIRTAIKKI